jgi:prepilin-type N-terminal cleavage/methylation domain-containing protein
MKTSCNRCTRASGFTLLEALLAMTILGLLLTTVYGSLSRTLRAKEIGEERAELFAAGREAVLRIADDIEGALLPKMCDRCYFKGIPTGGDPPADRLEFVTMNRGGYGLNRVCPGLVLVRYSLEQLGERRDNLVLRRDEDSWAELTSEADNVPSIIDMLTEEDQGDRCAKFESRPLLYCEGDPGAVRIAGSCIRVVGLSFRYFDKAIEGFRDEWDSAAMREQGEEERIPAAVQIALFLADDRGHFQEFTTVADIPLGRDQPVTPRPEDEGEEPTPGPQGPGGRTGEQ